MNKNHEPLIRIAKRDAMVWWKAYLIRIVSVVLALIVSAVVIFSITKLNPFAVYGSMYRGAFGTTGKTWNTIRDAMILLCISVGLAPAFKMRFWNIGAEGQVLMGALATAAIMLYYGAYFHKGVKRTFEELREIEREFELEVDLPAMILDVVCAESTEDIRIALKNLMWAVRFRTLPENEETKAPDASLAGTSEEMYSNWRSKMQEAAKNGDVYSSFMNLLSFEAMLDDIADQVELPFPTDIMGDFSPADLPANARLFDDALCQYREAYRQAGIEPVHYTDAEAFAADYLR